MASPEPGIRVIVLAAQRDGQLDPLAAEAGVSHKCLVPIGGRPLLAHVLDALSRVERVDEVRIVVERGAEARLAQVAVAAGMMARFAEAADNIADSVYAGAAGATGPVVITTADNVLLTPEAVGQMVETLQNGADVAIAMATRQAVLEAHPEGQRRFYRFTDDEYSNCNLYGFAGSKATAAAESFRGGGQFAKKPMRLIMAVGVVNVMLLALRKLTLRDALNRLSVRFGLRIEPVILKDGAHAVDVDNERTYACAALLLDRRRFALA